MALRCRNGTTSIAGGPRSKTENELTNTELIKEFNRYVRDHPEFAEEIPDDATVIMQLEGDETFNAWARNLAEARQVERERVVFVRIRKLAPVHSRIEALEVEAVA